MKGHLTTKISMYAGKTTYKILQISGKKGTALPGKVSMKIKPNLLKEMGEKCDKTILVTGTNGKTTINNLLNHVLKGKYNNITSNLNGSNLINGVVTPFIINKQEHYDCGVFEADEGTVPKVTQQITPNYIIITNFFRDQLDRYGEVENTIKMVHDAITDSKTILILNADNPSCLYFSDLPNPEIYYSHGKTENSKKQMDVFESVFCPICGNRLEYDFINYGNIGQYHCNNCGAKNPPSDYKLMSVTSHDGYYDFSIGYCNEQKSFRLNLMGIYNLYNCLAVIALSSELGLDYETIKNRIISFEYKLGRMEKINLKNKEVVLVLSKNPVGLSEVLAAFCINPNEKSLMFILNDYPADGEDISWIWDANFEKVLEIPNIKNFYCTGTRAEDAALRLKYAGFPTSKIRIYPSKDRFDIKPAMNNILSEDNKSYIIGTFTGMPEARKILYDKQKELMKK